MGVSSSKTAPIVRPLSDFNDRTLGRLNNIRCGYCSEKIDNIGNFLHICDMAGAVRMRECPATD